MLVLQLGSLRRGLTLLCDELGDVVFSGDITWGWRQLFIVFLWDIKVLAKQLYFANPQTTSVFFLPGSRGKLDKPRELICASLDWHSRAMVSKREQSPFPLHPRIPGLEFNFTHRESVTSMEGAIHIRECHHPKELRVGFTEGLPVHGRVLLECRGVSFEKTLLGPLSLVFLFDRDEGITFIRLSRALC